MEPILFGKLQPEICPTVYAHRECHVYRNPDPNSAEQPEIWNAWTTAMALPCDQALEADAINLEALLWHSLRCMCFSGKCGLLISDNGLFNFGVLTGRVVLIDAGSRQCEDSPLHKTRLTASLKRFWSKLNWYLKNNEQRQMAKQMRRQFVDSCWAPQNVSLDEVMATLRLVCAACPIYIAQPTAPVDAGSAAQPTPAANEFLRE